MGYPHADAVAMIQGAISKQLALKEEATAKLKRAVEMADARLECANERGAILSIKKVGPFQVRIVQTDRALRALERLLAEIQFGATIPLGYKKKVEAIEARPAKPVTGMSNMEMLDKLRELNLLNTLLACSKQNTGRPSPVPLLGNYSSSPKVTFAKCA